MYVLCADTLIMSTLIFGKGYFGERFARSLPGSIVVTDDITDPAVVAQVLDTYRPDMVINCAAKTGRPNVDWCESHKSETLDSNLLGPLVLRRACEARGIYFVQIGSGCIYEGDNGGRGWSEEDMPNFFGSFYSKTKAWMNEALKDFPVLQVRLRMPIDGLPGPRNLVTKLARYPQVINVSNSLSVVDDAIGAIVMLMEKRATGIYNVVNPGTIRHEDILDLYRELVDPTHSVEYISLDTLAALTVAGRSNCVLSTSKLEAAGIHLMPIAERVRELMVAYAKQVNSPNA
jgi:dTDP-4-dehydrorhamnose reductase